MCEKSVKIDFLPHFMQIIKSQFISCKNCYTLANI